MLIAIRKVLEAYERDWDEVPDIEVLVVTGDWIPMKSWRCEEISSAWVLTAHNDDGVTTIVPTQIVCIRATNAVRK
jgi:hypothetical protein